VSALDSTRVFDRSLRGAHDIEVLLGTFVGTILSEAQHVTPDADRAEELAHVSMLLCAHSETLGRLANQFWSHLSAKEAA